MRIVAITRVLNEADIIEAFIRHTSAFVAHHIIMDNGSSDDTINILASLKNEGLPITVYQSKSVSYNESDTLTRLYQEARKNHAPDWVLCIDSDEFLDDRQVNGGFHQFLAGIADPIDYIKIPMVFYAATSDDNQNEENVALRITKRLEPTEAYKIIIRGSFGDRDVCIAHGSHWATIGDQAPNTMVEPRLRLAHYAERSSYQYIVKFLRGWSKVLATGQAEISNGTAYHYSTPYEMLRDKPESLLLNQHFMTFKNEHLSLTVDPIEYRGAPLRYTAKNDEAMRAVRCMMGFVDELAKQHGRILDHFAEARLAVRIWETRVEKIL
jgi:glycosyltransferase involved in cell wall biosynthesis